MTIFLVIILESTHILSQKNLRSFRNFNIEDATTKGKETPTDGRTLRFSFNKILSNSFDFKTFLGFPSYNCSIIITINYLGKEAIRSFSTKEYNLTNELKANSSD